MTIERRYLYPRLARDGSWLLRSRQRHDVTSHNVAGDMAKILLPHHSGYLTDLDPQEAFVLARYRLIAADFPGVDVDEPIGSV